MSVAAIEGDSRDVIATMADASIDACVTDPPYALVSIVKRLGGASAAPIKDRDGVYKRAAAGFMGKRWDTGDTAFDPDFWREVLRVLKPGAHLVAFGGTRTYHRLAVAIEDAGFEIRDQIGWLYGSGFPKSHDVSKGIDKAAGAAREKIPTGDPVKRMIPGADQNAEGSWIKDSGRTYQPGVEIPATDAARQWQGWGTALKPAWEPIVLARKPLVGTVAANVLEYGTGAINVEACRVPIVPNADANQLRTMSRGQRASDTSGQVWGLSKNGSDTPQVVRPEGRWPANVIHDGSEEVVEAFPETESGAGAIKRATAAGYKANAYGAESRPVGTPMISHADSGSAARFFYSAKADSADRLGSKHPTVKPIDLMAYLIRLVTPKGGLVLDPFAGSGTTGMAAMREGMRAILIEREAEYVADIKRRIAHVSGGDAPLFAMEPP